MSTVDRFYENVETHDAFESVLKRGGYFGKTLGVAWRALGAHRGIHHKYLGLYLFRCLANIEGNQYYTISPSDYENYCNLVSDGKTTLYIVCGGAHRDGDYIEFVVEFTEQITHRERNTHLGTTDLYIINEYEENPSVKIYLPYEFKNLVETGKVYREPK